MLDHGTVSFMPELKRTSIFVSYSQRDRKTLEEFKQMLKPVLRSETLDLWDDSRIQTGDKWRDEIDQAIQRATLAVLLVSPAFLASDFIHKNELPPLLGKARVGGLRVCWICLDACFYARTPIGEYQAANDPKRPLKTLKGAARSQQVNAICEKLLAMVDHAANPISGEKSGSADIASQEPEKGSLAPFTLHQLRAIPQEFTGREKELEAVIHQVLNGMSGGSAGVAGICGVDGMAGVGKTELANAAGHRLVERFPDAQLFIPLGTHSPNPRSARQAAEIMLNWFVPTGRPPEDESALRTAYLGVLQGKRCLLILDDAKDDTQVDYLMPPAGCGMIVTSRSRLTCSRLAALKTLPPSDAVALLQKLCGRLTVPHTEELAGLCRGLPIALRVAGGYLHQNRAQPIPEYLAKLSTPERLTNLKHGSMDVSAVFEASYAALTPEPRVAWGSLSVFSASFDRAAGLAVIGGDAEAAGKALNALVTGNLLGFDEVTGRFRWHDLLREFAAKKGGKREAAFLRHARHFIAVGNECARQYLAGGPMVSQGLALFDRERAHMEAVFEWLSGRRDTDSAGLLGALVNAIAVVSHLRFHPRRSIQWMEAQLKAARATRSRKAESAALGNLGNAHRALGDARRSIEYQLQTLEIARETGDRRGQGHALLSLGRAHYALGNAHEAIAFYEQGLATARETGDRRGEGGALVYLGAAYSALGEVRRAIESYRQALAITRETGDREGEGNTLGYLGLACRSLGDAPKAMKYYQQYLAICREMGNRRGEGNALGNLGTTCAALGDAQKAVEYYEQAMTITRELGNRRGEGNVLRGLGLARMALGEPRKAVAYFEQSLKIAREIGARRVESSALGNLGSAYAALGETHKEVECQEQRLAIAREMGDRQDEGVALWNSASPLRDVDHRPGAIRQPQGALVILDEWIEERGTVLRPESII